ncbi:MAG TPA: hypothetical protein VJA94_12425 [Candidatus Angelobacter sp.]
MFCIFCGNENVGAFGHCNYCGSPLTPLAETRKQDAGAQDAGVPEMPLEERHTEEPPTPEAHMQEAPEQETKPATPPSPPVAASQSVSGRKKPAVSAAPSGVAVQAIGGRKKRNPALIIILVIVLAGAAGAVAFLTVNRESAEQRMTRLMREAAGLQPVKQALFASDRQFDDAFREQFRGIFRVNREFIVLESKVNTSEIEKLGSPESFTDPDYAAEGLRQLHASVIFHREFEQKLQDIADNLRHTIASTNWFASHKAEALAGFEHGFAGSLQKRQHVLNAEQAYVEAADDIYDYSYAHYTAFQLENGELTIADESVLNDFNSKIKQYNARHDDLLQAQEEFTRFQSDMLNKMGMSSKDVGLK